MSLLELTFINVHFFARGIMRYYHLLVTVYLPRVITSGL